MISLSVNGESHELEIDPAMPLLWALRDTLGLTGTKYSCGIAASGSCLTLVPLQDVFGWTDRINTPAVVDEINWTWRLPWPVDTWLDRTDTVARAGRLRAWTRDAGR